jgi:hypothetical protein
MRIAHPLSIVDTNLSLKFDVLGLKLRHLNGAVFDSFRTGADPKSWEHGQSHHAA